MIDIPATCGPKKYSPAACCPKTCSQKTCSEARTGIIALTFTALALATLDASEATAAETAWLTGRPLLEKLVQPAGVTWSGRELREGLLALASTNRVAVLVDRRVDPQQKLELAVSEGTLYDVFNAAADTAGQGFTLVGSIGYLGPVETARKLRTLVELRREEARQLPSAASRRLARLRPLAWEELATPRGVFQRIAGEAGFELAGSDRVPHDLWAAVELAPASTIDQLTLVAAMFDLTFRFDKAGRSIELVPLPDEVSIAKRYPAGPDAADKARSWQEKLPHCRVSADGNEIVVEGLVEDLERLEGRSKLPSPRKATLEEKRFSLKAQALPVEALLQYFSGQVDVDIRVDQEALNAAGLDLQQKVTFEVKEAALDEFMEAMLKPAGLMHRREGKVIYIKPR